VATPTNHYKLGLFVVIGFAAALLAAILFGSTHLRNDTTRYHSYFNESVQGLDLGSPVKFRGVTIGHVAAIDIAPDHRMVDVVSELDAKEIKRMGLTELGTERNSTKFAVPPDLRCQLNSQGVTGVKFVALDFFDIKSNPLPQLPFDVSADHYIPAASSMMKNLEDTISKAMERLPVMVDALVIIMERVDSLFATLEAQNVSGKAVAILSHADATLVTLQSTIERINKYDLGERTAATMSDVQTTVGKLNRILDAVDGKAGFMVSAQRATDTFNELGRAGRVTQKSLESTLRNVSEAAESIRTLADSLERDPDMLLKGKAHRKAVQ